MEGTNKIRKILESLDERFRYMTNLLSCLKESKFSIV